MITIKGKNLSTRNGILTVDQQVVRISPGNNNLIVGEHKFRVTTEQHMVLDVMLDYFATYLEQGKPWEEIDKRFTSMARGAWRTLKEILDIEEA
jgi:hypothetical protein